MSFQNNIQYVYLAHFSRMVLPFLFFPIIARYISVQEFGEFAFYQTVSIVISCVIEYGFAYTVVNKIAQCKKNIEVTRIVHRVEHSKTLMSLFILPLTLIYCFIYEDFYILIAVLSGIFSGATPHYYYQGKEKFNIISKVEIYGVLFYYSLVFFFSYFYVLNVLVLLLSYLISRAYVYLCLIYKIKIKIIYKTYLNIFNKKTFLFLKSNFLYFLQRSSMVLYSSFSVLVVNIFFDNKTLGFFSSAEKLVLVICGLIQPLQQVLLPYLSRRSLTKNFKFFIFLLFFLIMISSLITPFFSPILFSLYYGDKFTEAHKLFDILIFLVPLRFINSMLLIIFFLSKGKGKVFAKFYVKFVPVFLLLGGLSVNYLGVYGIIYTLILFELFLIIVSLYKIRFR